MVCQFTQAGEAVAGRVRASRYRLPLRPPWALLSAAPPIGMVNRLVEGIDEEAGDPLRLLVRDEVAGAGDGDQGCARACLERGPFVCGEPAVALLRVHHPSWYASVAESCRWRVVTIEVPQVGTQTLPHYPRVVLAEIGEQLSTAIVG